MPWLRTDDRFDDDADLDFLSEGAVALNLCAGTWSSRNLTDGFIPEARVRKLFGYSEAAVKLLLEAAAPGNKPWWIKVEGGYQIRNFLKYNPSAEQVRTERQRASERMQRARGPRSATCSNDCSPERTPERTGEPTHERTPEVRGVIPYPVSQLPDIPDPGGEARARDELEAPPWWETEEADRLAVKIALGLRSARRYESFVPGEFKVMKLLDAVRRIAPDDEAIIDVLEAFVDQASIVGERRHADPVGALERWCKKREAEWRQIKRERARDEKRGVSSPAIDEIEHRTAPAKGIDFWENGSKSIFTDAAGNEVPGATYCDSGGREHRSMTAIKILRFRIIDEQRSLEPFTPDVERRWYETRGLEVPDRLLEAVPA